jgi:sugar phosphate isomerase/epimerase
MKIGLNTYSFRAELEKTKTLTLDQVFGIAQKIGLVDGIELLDRHIPRWSSGDLKAGVAQIKELAASYKFPIYALGPHLKMYQNNSAAEAKEIQNYKKWIDLAADNGIPQIRSQVAGPFGFFAKKFLNKGVKKVQHLLDQVIPYAEKRNVKIGIETHWGYSSWPPFLKAITEIYASSPALGIIFDWGNFWNNDVRYGALELAVQPHNHVHNHVKIFHFGENYQETDYDSMKIVRDFAKNNFTNYFSIEFEGKQPTIEGVFKSVHALKYAITNGAHKIPVDYDWNSLLP